jgi:hypothetical protein
MSDSPTSEMVVGTEIVNGRELEIERTTWRDSAGLSYAVYDKATGNCLTEDESFDDYPTQEQVAAVVKRAEEAGVFEDDEGDAATADLDYHQAQREQTGKARDYSDVQ